MTKLAAISAAFALLFVIYSASVYFGQRNLLFPVAMIPARPSRSAVETVRLRLRQGTVEALFLPATTKPLGPAPLIIFTHGNAELADQWVGSFGEPRFWGWSALLLEYPGYGGSAGSPSEQSITSAASAAYDWASHDPRVDSTRIVAYGRSLGGGPAVRLAVDHPVAGLILESSFTSVRPFAAQYLIPSFLVRDPFDNLLSLKRYHGPLLVLHGRDDTIIPASQGRALAAAVPGAEFHELLCGHNDCPRPWPLIREFLVARGLLKSETIPGGA